MVFTNYTLNSETQPMLTVEPDRWLPIAGFDRYSWIKQRELKVGLRYLPLVLNDIHLLVWGHPSLAGLGEKMDDISDSFHLSPKVTKMGCTIIFLGYKI